ncbi:MAG: fused MFS/spermidine synthase, partial [Desulfuromonadaceae bacterium]
WGGVITVFMLALSIGYLLGGRLSLHSPSLRMLSFILLIAAVTTTPVVFASDMVLDAIFNLEMDPRYGSLLSAAILFFLPTMISGMISPYAVRLLVEDSKNSGYSAGLLYFVSTFGSALGTIITSFYLVMWLEVNKIIWGMIAISLGIGILAWLFSLTERTRDDA